LSSSCSYKMVHSRKIKTFLADFLIIFICLLLSN
jgi:hypothetical protein